MPPPLKPSTTTAAAAKPFAVRRFNSNHKSKVGTREWESCHGLEGQQVAAALSLRNRNLPIKTKSCFTMHIFDEISPFYPPGL